MAAEAVLLDLKAHELLLGQWLAQDLLQPDGVHSGFHSCRILRAHAAIVTSASDGPGGAQRRTSTLFRANTEISQANAFACSDSR
jgi:hypothetical protein